MKREYGGKYMSNVIAVIWDCDKTLIDGYMQSPMFEDLGVNESEFWRINNELPDKYKNEQGVRVNPDTIYLNHFIQKVKSGEFKSSTPINNEWLRSYGEKLKFYPGIPKFLKYLNTFLNDEKNSESYNEYHIKVENYIVSTGFKEVIKGSLLNEVVEDIWGCELIEDDFNGERIISEIGYTIDNTTKTRALFEINKGVNKDTNLDVNAKVPDELRRVPFEQMIYIADGPSDIPAFSVVNKGGGYTLAVYPHGDEKALKQVEMLRATGRVQMYAEANFEQGSLAFDLLTLKIKEMAEKILSEERSKRMSSYSTSPSHIV